MQDINDYFLKEVEMQKAYLSTQEVAKVLGISKQTLLRYEKRKIFPKPKRNLINKRREYSIQDIEKLKTIIGRR
ncbi:MAG: MerR family transcriptional regulator [Candidatus Omnitrophica bacterium]|nr:MerR family transcriptional regulator [Candidatus Omnitrophota bacterium]